MVVAVVVMVEMVVVVVGKGWLVGVGEPGQEPSPPNHLVVTFPCSPQREGGGCVTPCVSLCLDVCIAS